MSQAELPTTDGGIAVGNLLSTIESGERLLRAQQKDEPRLMGTLVELHCAVGQYLGRLADYDRAEALAERLVRLAPKEPASYLARARVRSVFHRFPEALADLGQAEALAGTAKDARIASLRIAILQAQGKLAEALALAQSLVAAQRRAPDLGSLGIEALLRGAMGQVREADALFSEAQRHFRDVAPFPVAWLYLQQGLMWEGEGMSGRARELYTAAHERLPAYATAASHLAAMEAATGGRDRAIAILRPIAQSSDDPEYLGQLAALLPAADPEAGRLLAQARARYEALLRRHPEAFASHAARFYLGPGKDPARAARLARQNLATAETQEAFALAVEAVQAGEGAQPACALADRALGLGAIGTRLRVACARALAACGQADRAAAELKKVTPP
jgi:tetratricopeptide (TPR) repeat protein